MTTKATTDVPELIRDPYSTRGAAFFGATLLVFLLKPMILWESECCLHLKLLPSMLSDRVLTIGLKRTWKTE